MKRNLEYFLVGKAELEGYQLRLPANLHYVQNGNTIHSLDTYVTTKMNAGIYFLCHKSTLRVKGQLEKTWVLAKTTQQLPDLMVVPNNQNCFFILTPVPVIDHFGYNAKDLSMQSYSSSYFIHEGIPL